MNDYEKNLLDRVVITYNEATHETKNIKVCDLVVYAKTNAEGATTKYNLGQVLDMLVDNDIEIKNLKGIVDTQATTIDALVTALKAQNEFNASISSQIKTNIEQGE